MFRSPLAFGLLVMFAFAARADESAESTLPALDAARFEKLHALLLPQEGEERWRSIPWVTDLWEARKLASEHGKPVFLWEMDGNPLGCT